MYCANYSLLPAAGQRTDCQLSLAAFKMNYLPHAVSPLCVRREQHRSGEGLPSSEVDRGASFGLPVTATEMLLEGVR